MRFSPLHLLLLATALAAPIRDVQQVAKSGTEDDLIVRGLVPLLERTPSVALSLANRAPPVRPKVPDGPKPPTRPPASPDTPEAKGNTPPRLGQDRDTPNAPGEAPPAAPPPKDADPINRPDDGLEAPIAACGGRLGRRGRCSNEDLRVPITNDEIQAMKNDGVKVLTPLRDRLANPNVLDNADPSKPKRLGTLDDEIGPAGNRRNPGYDFDVSKTPPKDNLESYTQDPIIKDAFKKEDFKEIRIKASRDNHQHIKNWADNGGAEASVNKAVDKALQDPTHPLYKYKEDNPSVSPDEIKSNYLMLAQSKALEPEPILQSLNNAKGGSVIVKKIFKENDPYQDLKTNQVDVPGGAFGLPNLKIDGRPPIREPKGIEKNAIHPSDQIMTSWRQAVKETQGGDVKNLKYVGMDEMITPDTKKLVDGIFKEKFPNDPFSENKRSERIEIKSTDKDFEALAGTAQSSPVIRMLTDYNKELGSPNVESFLIFKKRIRENGDDPNEVFRYDMVIKLSRDPQTTASPASTPNTNVPDTTAPHPRPDTPDQKGCFGTGCVVN